MPTEEIQIDLKLKDVELRLMKTASRHTKMSRFIFKSLYKFAVRFKLNRLEMWSYLKWFKTYSDEPFGFWEFTVDFFRSNISSYAASFLEI